MKFNKVLLVLTCAILVACQSAPTKPAVAAQPVTPKAVATEAPTASTPKPTPAVTPAGSDRVQATRDGFSPKASVPNNTLALELQWSGIPLSAWEVAIAATDGTVVRTFRGTDTVPSLTWDGLSDAAVLPPQGRYHAVLRTAGADSVLVDRDTSQPFVLDLVPPSGTITVTPSALVSGTTVNLQLSLVSGGAPWTTWRLAVFHPDGRRFRDFISEENREDAFAWDGRAVNGATLEVGVTYRLEAEVFDIYGNKGTITTELPVRASPIAPVPALIAAPSPAASPVVLTLDGKVLAELPVYFAPYSSKLDSATPSRRATNQKSLAQLAHLLTQAQGTPVVVVGHANHVLYQDPVKKAFEQKETLLPLSLGRAETVRDALVELGVSRHQLTVKGLGGDQPLVPFSDAENRWMNRRVVVELTPP